MKHVIIGASAAGMSAAATIRKLRADDEIVVISSDDAIHSRCMLHKFISGERDEAGLSFIPDKFFTDNNIRWLSGVTVTGLDTQNKVAFYDGGQESYDRLLIATGTENILPPGVACGADVLALRNLCDAKAIRERAATSQNIVIIGAGLVGLDIAYALLEMGKKPIVVDKADSILPANLDKRAASVYQSKFEEAGCSFRLGVNSTEIVCDGGGVVTAVAVDGAENLPCDLVISATGVRPAVGFLESASGIICVAGVVVNKYLATGAPGVYAAGDVTGLSNNWPNAVNQGKVAAFNMCDVPTVYDDMFALKNTINFFDVLTLSVGQFNPSAGDVEHCREDRARYEKVVMRGGVPVGVIRQGDISHSGFWQHLVKNEMNVAGIPLPVWKLSFADYFGIDSKGEYKWAAAPV